MSLPLKALSFKGFVQSVPWLLANPRAEEEQWGQRGQPGSSEHTACTRASYHTKKKPPICKSKENFFFHILKKMYFCISTLVQVSVDSYFMISDAASWRMQKAGRLADKFLPFQLPRCCWWAQPRKHTRIICHSSPPACVCKQWPRAKLLKSKEASVTLPTGDTNCFQNDHCWLVRCWCEVLLPVTSAGITRGGGSALFQPVLLEPPSFLPINHRTQRPSSGSATADPPSSPRRSEIQVESSKELHSWWEAFFWIFTPEI